MSSERAHDDILRLARLPFAEFDVKHVTAGAPHRKMDVAHRRKIPAQMVQQRRFTWNRAKDEMFVGAADDGMEDRVVAVRNPIDFDDLALGALAVILRKFPERAFRCALMW